MSCRCATCGNITQSKNVEPEDSKTQLRKRLEQLEGEQEDLEARLTNCLIEQARIREWLKK